jgi:hypothetical protein
VEQELLTLAPEFTHGFSGVRVTPYIVFCVMFWRSFFVLLYFFFWPLCCLIFYLRLLIAPLVSSNCSCYSIFSFICMFCRSLFVLLYFSFGHCVVCSSSIYGFWLLLWYLQTFLTIFDILPRYISQSFIECFNKSLLYFVFSYILWFYMRYDHLFLFSQPYHFIGIDGWMTLLE